MTEIPDKAAQEDPIVAEVRSRLGELQQHRMAILDVRRDAIARTIDVANSTELKRAASGTKEEAAQLRITEGSARQELERVEADRKAFNAGIDRARAALAKHKGRRPAVRRG